MKFTAFILFTFFSNASAFSPSMGGSAIKTTTKTQAGSASSDLNNDGNNKQQQSILLDPLGLYPNDSLERRSGLIQSLDTPSQVLLQEKDQTVIDPLSLYQDKSELTEDVVMSASLPFLKRPEMLDGTLPGDRGFDPFNFSSNPSALTWYRDSEIKHARLAMLAAVGWPVAELTHKSIASQFDLKPLLGLHDKVPSVLNGGLSLTNPLFWVGTISAAAALEFIATKNGDDDNNNNNNREAGDFGFDPLSIMTAAATGNNNATTDKQAKFFMQEAEIFNGRIAMLAITGFVAQEYYTNMAVIDQTPIFFKPFGDVVAQLLGASGGATSL